MRARTRKILEDCHAQGKPCVLALGRPYHMDTGIGHDIESELQTFGFPVIWGQYLPLDEDFLDRYFAADIRSGRLKSPFDISDIWPSSYRILFTRS